MARVAFLGLGRMGAPMAGRLAAAGHELTVWSRTRKHADALADRATVADSPAAAGAKAEIAVTMLLDGGALEEVALGRDGLAEGLPSGSLHIDMSTTGPRCQVRSGSPRTASRGPARSTGVSSPPIMIASVPWAAGPVEPATGASTKAISRGSSAFATFRAAAGPVVDMSI